MRSGPIRKSKIQNPKSKILSRLAALCSIAAAVLCNSCSTAPVAAKKHAPIERVELLRKADAVLAYVEKMADALPADLFAAAPLEDTGNDRVQELHETAAAMREDAAAVAALKAQGVLGEDNRGYLDLRDDGAFADAAAKNAAQQTMSEENDRRKALYRGVARASEEKGLTLTRVERAFAAQRLVRSAPGALVQLPSNVEEFEAFAASPIGARLGARARPGDWVALP